MNMKKFTLVELIVVIAIIGILLTLLLPSLRTAKQEAMLSVCLSNQAQTYRALVTYGTENHGNLPEGSGSGEWLTRGKNGDFYGLGKLVESKKLQNTAVFYCPSWSHPVIQYDTKDSSGKYGGYPADGISYPKKRTWISYAYRHYPKAANANKGGNPANLMKDESTIAITSDHWTRREGQDFGWTNGNGKFGHYEGKKYATTYLDGSVKTVHDRSRYLIYNNVYQADNSGIEGIWQRLFDKN